METPPVSVNFTALDARLSKICPTRPGSPSSRRGRPGAGIATIDSPFARAPAPIVTTVVSVTNCGENAVSSSVMRPAPSLAWSRMSFSIRSRLPPDSRIITAISRCAGVSRSSSKASASPITAFIGVRISWLTVAMKRAFAASARPAASSASRNPFAVPSSACRATSSSRIRRARLSSSSRPVDTSMTRMLDSSQRSRSTVRSSIRARCMSS